MAADTIATLELQVQSDAQKATRALDALAKKLMSLQDVIGNFGGKNQFANFSNGLQDAVKGLKDITQPLAELKKGAKGLDKLSVKLDTKDIDAAIKSLRTRFADAGKDFVFTGNSTELEKAINAAQGQLSKLLAKEAEMKDLGANIDGTPFVRLQRNIMLATNQLDVLREAQKKLQADLQKSFANLPIHRGDTSTGGAETDPRTAEMPAGGFKYDASAMKAVFGEAFANIQDWGDAVKQLGNNAGSVLNGLSDKFEKMGAGASGALNSTVEKSANLKKALQNAQMPLEQFEQALQGLETPEINENSLKKLQSELDRTRQKIENLNTKKENDVRLGVSVDSTPFRNLLRQIAEAENHAEKLEEKIKAVSDAAKPGPFQKLKNIVSGLPKIFERLSKLMKGFSGLSSKISKGFSGLTSTVKKIGGGLGSLAGKAAKASKMIAGLGKSKDKKGPSLGDMFNMSVIYSTISSVISSVKQAVAEGSENLAQYSGSYNKSLSSVMSGLTQLKNAFAAAFAPIINVVAPILSNFISLLSKGANQIGIFFASLTGQSFTPQALPVVQDFAASLSGTEQAGDEAAAGMDTATGSAKKLKKALSVLSFDELNQLSAPAETADTGSAGAAGAGTTELLPSDMFETAPVLGKMAEFGEKLRAFFQDGNWAGLGNFLASGINTGLERLKQIISWDNVGPAVTSFANAFTTSFNGLVSGVDWNLLGSTIGTGINTIVNTLDLFVTGIDWENLGGSFADGVNGIVTTVDWNNLGNLIGNFFMISFRAFRGFVENLDWVSIGTALATGLNGILETFDLSYVASGIATFVNGLSSSLLAFAQTFDWTGLGTEVFTAINTFFSETDFAQLGESLSTFAMGLLSSVVTALEGVDWQQIGQKTKDFLAAIDWGGLAGKLSEGIGAALGGLAGMLWGLIKDGWDSVVKWWKDTAFKDGQFTISGLLNGIWEGIKNIGSWIYDHIFKPFIDGFKKAFGINSPSTVMADQGNYIISGLLGGLKDKFVTVISWLGELPGKFKEFFQKAKDKVVEVFGNIGSWFSDKFSGAWTSIKNAFSLSNAKNFFKDVWNGITSSFGNIAGWFKDKFSAAWQAVKNVFSSGGKVFDGIKDGILNGLKAVINGLIRGINDVIAVPFNGINWALRNIRDIEILGFKPFDWIGEIGVPQIPYLAKGAVIPPNAPFAAILGDQKKGLNIETPVDVMRKVFRGEFSEEFARARRYQIADLENWAADTKKQIDNQTAILQLEMSRQQNMTGGNMAEFADMVAERIVSGIMMADSNRPININLQTDVKLPDEEVIARAAARGQQRIDQRYNPAPKFA